MAERLRYYKGSKDRYETIELDTFSRNGLYITTCVINVQLLTAGVKSYPCGNGDDLTLSPEQRLTVLEFLQERRKEITDRYPVKTYEGWQESGLPTFEDYCKPGEIVDEAVVEHFINSVPPVSMWACCTQAGEAYSSELDEITGRHKDTYTTFHRIPDGLWKFDGYCFFHENENRVTRPGRLEEITQKVRQEVQRG